MSLEFALAEPNLHGFLRGLGRGSRRARQRTWRLNSPNY
ncbi:Protein of unknown function [Gryllus bimaculatus]|nr:Protein of unknown function [Gryllus bimaculatus]